MLFASGGFPEMASALFVASLAGTIPRGRPMVAIDPLGLGASMFTVGAISFSLPRGWIMLMSGRIGAMGLSVPGSEGMLGLALGARPGTPGIEGAFSLASSESGAVGAFSKSEGIEGAPLAGSTGKPTWPCSGLNDSWAIPLLRSRSKRALVRSRWCSTARTWATWGRAPSPRWTLLCLSTVPFWNSKLERALL